jgi:transposase-like protein
MTANGTPEDEKLRWETERTLERAKEIRLRSEQTLRESRRRLKRIRADLRRAGLLRD